VILSIEEYELLTTPKNYASTVAIHDQFQLIKQKILLDFWLDVKSELERTNTSSWKVFMNEGAPEGNSKLGFYHPTYSNEAENISSFLIIFEKLSGKVLYGLWFNRTEGVQNLDYKATCEKVKEQFPAWIAGSGSGWFAAIRYTNDDFGSPSQLIKILPANRDGVVKQYAETLRNSLSELEQFAFENGKILNTKMRKS
jgi:hypothetical protein